MLKGERSMNYENLRPGLSLYVFILIAVSLLMPLPNALSLDPRGLKVVPDEEKRSSIHEVDGYAYLGEDTTLRQARTEALAVARRQALEMARTYMESNSLVKDGKLEYDLIKSGAQGYVSVLKQKDHGLEGNRYHVWIRAEVKYDLKPPGKQDESIQIMSPDAPLTVKVWTSRKQYAGGENVEVYIRGNRGFYARIVNIDSRGNITQILPNDHRNMSYFEGGEVYKIPDKGDRFALMVTDTYGQEEIVVYASEVPLGQVVTEPVGRGLRGYRGTREQFARGTRSIKIVPLGGSSHSGAGFYEGTWKFTTSR